MENLSRIVPLFVLSNASLRVRQCCIVLSFLCAVHILLCSVALGWEGVGLRVLDGDTLELLNHNNKVVRIHLYGVESPLPAHEHGQAAMEHFASLIVGKTVDVTNVGRDCLGRMRSMVVLDGRSVNEEMVRVGYARVSNVHGLSPSCRQWLEVERTARLEGRGVWRGQTFGADSKTLAQANIDGPVVFEAN